MKCNNVKLNCVSELEIKYDFLQYLNEKILKNILFYPKHLISVAIFYIIFNTITQLNTSN